MAWTQDGDVHLAPVCNSGPADSASNNEPVRDPTGDLFIVFPVLPPLPLGATRRGLAIQIPKRLIGKEVRIIWLDPRALKLESFFPEDHRDVPKGKAGLARWTERGLIEKVEEDILYLLQGIGEDPKYEQRRTDTCQYSVIPCGIIEQIVVLGEVETLGGEGKEEAK